MIGTYDTRTPGQPLPAPRVVKKLAHLTIEQDEHRRLWRIDGRLAAIMRYQDNRVEAFTLNPLMNRAEWDRVLANVRANRYMTEEEWQIFVVEAGYGE